MSHWKRQEAQKLCPQDRTMVLESTPVQMVHVRCGLRRSTTAAGTATGAGVGGLPAAEAEEEEEEDEDKARFRGVASCSGTSGGVR